MPPPMNAVSDADVRTDAEVRAPTEAVVPGEAEGEPAAGWDGNVEGSEFDVEGDGEDAEGDGEAEAEGEAEGDGEAPGGGDPVADALGCGDPVAADPDPATRWPAAIGAEPVVTRVREPTGGGARSGTGAAWPLMLPGATVASVADAGT